MYIYISCQIIYKSLLEKVSAFILIFHMSIKSMKKVTIVLSTTTRNNWSEVVGFVEEALKLRVCVKAGVEKLKHIYLTRNREQ